jgi:hypothetical protein
MWETPPDAAAKKKGVVRAEAQIPAGSSFDLTLLKVRAIQDHHALDTYNRAVECFMAFGSIGYRKSRGFGCWVADSKMGLRSELEELLATMKPPGFTWQLAQGGSNDPMVIFRQIEARLKGDKIRKTGLRLEHRAKDATPLGYSHGPGKRQSSAVYFRPIGFKTKAGDKQYSLLIFQAPDTVLGAEVKSAYKGRTRII